MTDNYVSDTNVTQMISDRNLMNWRYIPVASSRCVTFVLVQHQFYEIMSRLTRCLIVGLPWGQFHGCSISPMWTRSFFISLTLRAVPTITWRCSRNKQNQKVFRKKPGKNTAVLFRLSKTNLQIWILPLWCLLTEGYHKKLWFSN